MNNIIQVLNDSNGKTLQELLVVLIENGLQYQKEYVSIRLYFDDKEYYFNNRNLYEYEFKDFNPKDVIVTGSQWCANDIIFNEDLIIKIHLERKSMKKLFISCPMKGRKEEDIKKSMEVMHKIAELAFGEELEVIDSYIEDNPPKDNNQAIWFLGESLKKLANADAFIGIADNYTNPFSGCEIELETARRYGLDFRTIFIDEFACFDDIARFPCTPVAGKVSDSTPIEGGCSDGCCVIDFGE